MVYSHGMVGQAISSVRPLEAEVTKKTLVSSVSVAAGGVQHYTSPNTHCPWRAWGDSTSGRITVPS